MFDEETSHLHEYGLYNSMRRKTCILVIKREFSLMGCTKFTSKNMMFFQICVICVPEDFA